MLGFKAGSLERDYSTGPSSSLEKKFDSRIIPLLLTETNPKTIPPCACRRGVFSERNPKGKERPPSPSSPLKAEAAGVGRGAGCWMSAIKRQEKMICKRVHHDPRP